MTSIHERPASVLARELFGDWEGDLIKGAGNASAIGTLVERKSRFTILVKMKDCGAKSRATLTPPLKSSSALISLRKIGIEGVIFRVQP